MRAKKWLVGWMSILIVGMGIVFALVYEVDPFFHYHKPNTDKYYYILNNERSQNDGIVKYFEYDALITGSSMTENFKTSELDELFGTKSIKVSFSGCSYRESNDIVRVALENNPELKIVIRGLDLAYLSDKKDRMKEGDYPTYLYDQCPFNDMKYVYNKEVFLNRVLPMIEETKESDFIPGIDKFDEYSRWQEGNTFGINAVVSEEFKKRDYVSAGALSEQERLMVIENIEQNLLTLPREYPNVDFYYFLTPYSALWWYSLYCDGRIEAQVEKEQIAIESVLKCNNIHFFSFNNCHDMITDFNNYRDENHYGEWINSFILKSMKNGDYLLTQDNYKYNLTEELAFYSGFDYSSINGQEDYGDDYEAARRLYLNSTFE